MVADKPVPPRMIHEETAQRPTMPCVGPAGKRSNSTTTRRGPSMAGIMMEVPYPAGPALAYKCARAPGRRILHISGCGGELALAALCGDCDAPPRVGGPRPARKPHPFLHPFRPCLVPAPVEYPASRRLLRRARHGRAAGRLLPRLRGRAGLKAFSPARSCGAAAPAQPTVFMAPAILLSASSLWWWWRPCRVNTASPPSNASNTQVISHPNPRPSLPGSAPR